MSGKRDTETQVNASLSRWSLFHGSPRNGVYQGRRESGLWNVVAEFHSLQRICIEACVHETAFVE